MEIKKNDHLRDWDQYLAHYTQSDGCYMPEEHSWQAERTLPRLGWAAGIMEREKAQSMIDLGCKDGYLALSMPKFGLETKGIDLSKDAIDVARERSRKFNLTTQFQTIAIEEYVDDRRYDFACLLEVIDRVIDPDKVLLKCKELASNLLLTTPDFYSRFGWDDERNGERLRIYKEPELKKLLNKYGTIKEFQILDGAYFVHVKLF